MYLFTHSFLVALTLSSTKGASEVHTFSINEKPYGLTFGQWTVRWWKWLLSCPESINPAIDENGEDSGSNQNGPVWFLAGTFGEKKIAHRKCTVPCGKCILFPVINYEVNFLENPEIMSEDELLVNVVKDQNDIINLVAMVDNQQTRIYRVQSDPKLFFVDLAPKNCLGLPSARITIASDGHWVFLKPLDKGLHKIFFHGSCSGGLRSCTAFYDLTVL